MKEMINEGRNILKKNKNLVIICHSFSGILINCILKKIKYSPKKIIIISSPLKMNAFGLEKRKDFLGYDENLKYNCEVFSFGSYFDEAIPFWLTSYSNRNHKNLWVDHMGVLWFFWIIRKIMRISKI